MAKSNTEWTCIAYPEGSDPRLEGHYKTKKMAVRSAGSWQCTEARPKKGMRGYVLGNFLIVKTEKLPQEWSNLPAFS